MTAEPIDQKHLQAAIAVALKLAKYRRTRVTTETDEVCASAVRAVVEDFERSGWVVVRGRQAPGWGSAENLPNFGKKQQGDCE